MWRSLSSKTLELNLGGRQRVLNDLKRTRLSRRLMIWLLSHPLPLSRQQVVSLSPSSCVSPVELTEGGQWERSQIIRQRESLVIYESFSTLWRRGKNSESVKKTKIRLLDSGSEKHILICINNISFVTVHVISFLMHSACLLATRARYTWLSSRLRIARIEDDILKRLYLQG